MPDTSCAPHRPQTAHAVEAEHLGRQIDDRTILTNLSFDVPRGRFVALLGANGAGKSTLLKVIAGLMQPSAGWLSLFGETVFDETGARNRRPERARVETGEKPATGRGLGFIGHTPMLYRDLSARENLTFFARLTPAHAALKRGGKGAVRERVDQVLDAMGLLDRADDPVKWFSRGMVQRVAIARALLNDPELLLADEPFAGLDAPSRCALEATLADLHQHGKTIILTNHDIAQSLDLASATGGMGQVMVLHRGRLVLRADAKDLTPGEVLAEIEHRAQQRGGKRA